MIRFFYDAQTFIEARSTLAKKVTYRLFLFMLRRLVPVYYFFNRRSESGVNKRDRNNGEPQVILSLTTFPPRMKYIWQVLESLLRQTHKPDKIILWLARSQFPTINHIDTRVRAMVDRGVEIRFCDEDLRSHKKYYFTMKEFKNDIVITVDDDIFYPENMIEMLMFKNSTNPKEVVCLRAHKIKLTNGKVDKYENWMLGSKGIVGPDHLLMATNGGGALYPPNSLNKEVFNLSAIKELCPTADDIWLKCMSFLNGTKTVKVNAIYSEVFTTTGSNNNGLAKFNVIEGFNDTQLKNVMNRYSINFSKIE